MMNRIELFSRLKRERSNAISPIIATLLLILIAIAAGVVVYAYVLGFVGSNTSGTGTNQSQMSIDTAVTTISGSQITSYTVVVRNVGSTTASISALYFTDNTNGGKVSILSSLGCGSTSLAPQSATTCTASSLTDSFTGGAAQAKGDSMTVQVVAADGGSTTYTFKSN
jgi:archaeal type IV pilus assembly protein PilA